MYGFSTWLKDIAELNVLTLRTLPGFLNYILYTKVNFPNDPFKDYFEHVRRSITFILKECYDENYPKAKEGHEMATSAEFDEYWEENPPKDIKVQFRVDPPQTLFLPDLDIALGQPNSKYLKRAKTKK